MKNSQYIFTLIILGSLLFTGCSHENIDKQANNDKNQAPVENLDKERLNQALKTLRKNKEKKEEKLKDAKLEYLKVQNNTNNVWMEKFDYFCMETGNNTCTPNGCFDGTLTGPNFTLVKNKGDEAMDFLVQFHQMDADEIVQYCGDEKVDLYSLNSCWTIDGKCDTEFDYFNKKQFSESVVYTDNNSSGHVIRINNKTKDYIHMEAVGAEGTNIHFSYGKCFTYGEI